MESKTYSLTDALREKRDNEARFMRQELFARCRDVLNELGGDLSGFALVVWSRDGELRSAYDTGFGPLKSGLVPTLASDALNRHVTLDMAPSRRSDETS